ncbi:hypothetical protein ACTWQL_08075 [Pseudalkalibacillus sp. R45]|uniref:hypothetical protein n=1 Tax=Pseudalkalibacillus sp. R45 TaxID=3457433 RepID=UPI003FCE1B49
MLEYTGLAITLAIILIPVLFIRTLNRVMKIIIVAYYGIVTTVFIYGHESIYEKYHTTPVPKEFWDKNTTWTNDLSLFYFVPLIPLILYIFYKWFFLVEKILTKFLVILAFIAVVHLYLFLLFMFNFAYGYRP